MKSRDNIYLSMIQIKRTFQYKNNHFFDPKLGALPAKPCEPERSPNAASKFLWDCEAQYAACPCHCTALLLGWLDARDCPEEVFGVVAGVVGTGGIDPPNPSEEESFPKAF